MTDINAEVEASRQSFERGANRNPRQLFRLASPELELHLEAKTELITRGLMDEHWALTEAGRAWASR